MLPTRIAPIAALALGLATLPVSAQVFGGVNLAGAEFGETQLPGSYGTHYVYPTPEEVDYYADKGMNAIRIPFRWERLQPALGGPLDADELARLRAIVLYATARGVNVVLDPHNYARYYGEVVGSSEVPDAAFADFWFRIAAEFANDGRVFFGLMNEPHDMPTRQWLDAANAAIAAIRAAAAHNLILVPGNGSSGAHSWADDWYGEPNASAMTGVVDPLDHFVFEVHQYLDGNSSGKSPAIVSATIGSQRLAGFTEWLRDHGYRGWLGEFAVARETIGAGAQQIGDEALADLLDHVADNADVWLGWTWWAGGPWWGEYMFTLEPQQLGQPGETDRPQMAELEPHLLPEPRAGLPAGIAAVAALAIVRQRCRSSSTR
jgi:endoglucanase